MLSRTVPSNSTVSCITRFEGNDAAVVVASYTVPGVGHPRVGERLTLEGDNIAATGVTHRAHRPDGQL